MGRFSNRGGEGLVGAMSFCFWVLCCWLFLCIVTTHATTHQNEHPSQGFAKRHTSRDSPSSASGLSLHHQANVPESLRSVRSSLGLPISSSNRNDDTFWAMRGKRPETNVNTNQEERPRASGSLPEKQSDSNTDDEAYNTDKEADEDLGDENNISETVGTDGSFWFSPEKETEDGDEDEDMLLKRNQPYWISRGKKAISDYLPFYWGSNQNVWGKMPLRRTPPSPVVARREPNQFAKIPRSSVVSGWESNQSLWGKRSDKGPFWIPRGRRDNNGPFWVSRGKKPDTNTGPYWIARGKRPFYADQDWGSNPFSLGKRTNGEEDGEGITDFQESELLPKRGDNGPFWVSRGKKSTSQEQELEDSSRGRRSQNTTFWVTRGKKAGNDHLFWVARGKKELEEKSPFWIARGKKEDETPTNFWVARGKKEDKTPTNFWVARGKKDSDKTPYWIARGKKEDETPTNFWVARGKKDSDKTPYWIARGKKEDETPTNFWVARGKKEDETPTNFWVARGKKEDETSTNFWVARGKKENETPTNFWVARGKKDSDKTPYWIARGKKEEAPTNFWVSRGKKDNDKTPYWIARGKKESEATPPFWVARGKKESNNPFWVARGKKDDSTPYWIARGKKENPTSSLLASGKEENINPFWIARGKKEEGSNPYWITRGKKEPEITPFWVSRGKKTGSDNPFWVARGKKDDSEAVDDGSFWISRGRRAFWAAYGNRPQLLQEKDRELLMAYVMEALLNEQVADDTDEPQGLRGKKGSSSTTKQLPQPQNDDAYAKGFIALRG